MKTLFTGVALICALLMAVGCASTKSAEIDSTTQATESSPTAAPAATNLVFADIPFRPFNPEQPEGIHVYALSGNPQEEAFTAVVRFPAGFMMPLHIHDFAYDGVALSDGLVHGAAADDTHDVPKGSVWRQPAGEPHVDGCRGDSFCYFLVSFEGPVNMQPVDAPAADPRTAMTKPELLQWKEVKGGVMMSVIRGNPAEGPFLALFDFPAGMQTNVHTHSASFDGAVLSGVHHRGASPDQLVTLAPNSVWHEPANSPHMEKCGEGARCIVFASMDGALDTKDVVLTPTTAK